MTSFRVADPLCFTLFVFPPCGVLPPFVLFATNSDLERTIMAPNNIRTLVVLLDSVEADVEAADEEEAAEQIEATTTTRSLKIRGGISCRSSRKIVEIA